MKRPRSQSRQGNGNQSGPIGRNGRDSIQADHPAHAAHNQPARPKSIRQPAENRLQQRAADIVKQQRLHAVDVGATQALEYLPVPGRFEGDVPMQPGQKAWAISR